MPATVLPVYVRASVYCDAESFARLNEIGKRWDRVSAAQQSNIVNDAEACASSTAASADRQRGNWPTATDRCADRLRRLVAAWPSINRRKQAELVDYCRLVRGEFN